MLITREINTHSIAITLITEFGAGFVFELKGQFFSLGNNLKDYLNKLDIFQFVYEIIDSRQ
jgi:DNA-directed RNA polymerase subunit L